MQSEKDTVIFLDVDGVINYLGMEKRPYGYRLMKPAHRFYLAIPEYMPNLIQELSKRYEIHWLTAWREQANVTIAPLLGIDPLPVITDRDLPEPRPGQVRGLLEWKTEASRELAQTLLAEGKRVVWIEDFYGRLPETPGIEYLDTGEEEVLLPWDVNFLLPEELQVPEQESIVIGYCGECGQHRFRHGWKCSKGHRFAEAF